MIQPADANMVLFSALLPRRQPRFWARLQPILAEHRVLYRFITGTRDIWARDFCPVQVSPTRFVQFTYTPDYLADVPGLRTRREEMSIPPQIRWGRAWGRSALVVDGGNIVAGEGGHAVLTDKVLAENPRCSRAALLTRLNRLLRAEKLTLIPREPWDIFGHADGILWFVGRDHVIVNDYRRQAPAYRKTLLDRLTAAGIGFDEVPYTPRQSAGNPHSAFGTYTNILQVGNLVLVPAYGQTQDKTVIRIVRRLTNDQYPVEGIDCRDLSLEGGCINCVAWAVQLATKRNKP